MEDKKTETSTFIFKLKELILIYNKENKVTIKQIGVDYIDYVGTRPHIEKLNIIFSG